MSEERNRSIEPTTTSQSALPSSYPSTSLTASQPPQMPANNNGASENGSYSLSPPSTTLQTESVSVPVSSLYFPPSSKAPTSNGQPIQRRSSYAANSNHNSQPSPSEQPSTNFTESRSSNSTLAVSQNDHPLDQNPTNSSSSVQVSTQQNDNNNFHQNEAAELPTNTINTTPPASTAYKAQITTTSLKPKVYNGGDKTPIPVVVDQIEPSTSVPSAATTTTTKSTPKTSNPRVRTPARSRQKGGEPKTPRSANQQVVSSAGNTVSQSQISAPSTTGTKRPHPNQYTYQNPQTKDARGAPPYQRYNSVPVSSQVHHGSHQQVQYSIPASNYGSPKIYVQSQGSSAVPSSATYTLHQRPGTNTVAQRTSVPSSGAGQPQVIIQCRPDQQPYSQGQPPNHFIIQTQQQSQAGDQPPTAVYQQRPGVGGRPGSEAPRQYIQTLQNGPPPSSQATVANAHGQPTSVAGGQHQVLQIQFHHGELQPGQQKVLIQQQGPQTGTVQQQLMDKRLGQLPNGPQQSIGPDQQLLSNLADRNNAPTSSASNVHINQHPSSSNQQQVRAKITRTLLPQVTLKAEDAFDDMNMHPSHVPLPDSFNSILDQIHASGESPKAFYRRLKKQFKYLVYENECYQEELRNSQRHLLKLSRDKNFLLDRLLNYESAEEPSDDSDADSDATIEEKPKPKKKKVQPPRKRTNTAASKKATAKLTPKPEDENSQGSVDSAGLLNSQASTSAHSFPHFPDPSIASTSANEK